MQDTYFLVMCAVVSMVVSLSITVFYKQIRKRFWKDKYKLPDKIPLFPELEAIPDRNNFVQSSHLLDSIGRLRETPMEDSVVDALITDESARQSGFSLQGENLLLECKSPEHTLWHEIRFFPVTIGKSEDCDVCLRDEFMANDWHGVLFVKDNGYFYLDMNSINGSIVDNVPVTGLTEIVNGSRIQISKTTIRLVWQSGIKN